MAQAASIGLGIGGAIISTALGVGPGIGFLAGSTLGSLFFGPGNETMQDGPRLSDLSVTSSAYGRTIPVIIGTARIGGNVIVSSDKIESKQSHSAKGNPLAGPEVDTFHYRVHFMWTACLGDGTQKLLKVYADKKLIYDSTSDFLASTEVKLGGLLGGHALNFPDFALRWLPGGPNQEVDSRIEELIGEDNSPAYRQLACIMFEDFKLDKYGNRVPQIEAVVSSTADTDYTTLATTFLGGGELDGFQTNSLAVDWRRKRWITDDAAASPAGWRVFRTDTMVEQFQITEDDFNDSRPAHVTGTGLNEVLAINPIDGAYYCNGDGGNASPIFRVDPDTFAPTHQFGASGLGLSFGPNSFQTLTKGTCVSTFSLLGSRTYFLCSGVLGDDIGILDADDMTFVGTFAMVDFGGTTPAAFIPTPPQEDTAICYVICEASGGSYALVKVEMEFAAFYGAPYTGAASETVGARVTHIKDFDRATYTAGNSAGVAGAWWDESDNTIILMWGFSNTTYMVKYDPNEDQDIWLQTYNVASRASQVACQYDIIQNNTLAWVEDVTARTVTQISTLTGEVLMQVTNAVAGWLPATVHQMCYNSAEESIITLAERKIWLNRLGGDTVTLRAACEVILDYAGYDSSEYDMSALSGVSFHGYVLSRPSAARQFLEQLSSAFFFSIVESDFVLKGVLKSNPDTVSISQDDLGQVGGELEGVPLTIDRIQEEELPGEVTLLYSEPSRDYQTGTQSIKRVSLPDLYTMQSDHNMVVEMPLMLEADDARQMAEKMMFTSWVERNLFQLVLPWRYLALDPADVITLTMDDGTVYSIRATTVDIGANMTIEVKGVANDTPSFASTISGTAGDGFKDKTLFTQVPTELFVMQTPLLRDADDQNRTGTVFYVAAGALSAGWTAAFLYESPDATSFAQIGSFVDEVTWGAMVGVVPEPPGGLWNVFDGETELTFRMGTVGATLTSVTYDALFASEDVNALLVGDEVIRFQTATDNGDGTYTLTGLLRGRRGTDYAVDRHTIGERAVLLETSTIQRIEKDLGAIGQARYYKAVSVGESLDEVFPLPVTIEGNDLKPYAPENIQRDDDSSDPDIVVTWVRRTRVDNEFRNGEDVAPLNEDSEEYEAYILSAPYDPDTFDADDSSTYVRAYTGLTSETFTYTDAEQTTDDFEKLIDPLYLVIFQVSAQVGRGWPGDVTLYGPSAEFYTIVGENGAGSTSGADFPSNNTLWNQYTAPAHGYIERVDAYFSGNADGGNIRVGVYTDNSDLPDALLSEEDDTFSIGHPLGFHEVTLSTPAGPFTAGEKFWLAIQVSTDKNGARGSPIVTGIQRQRSGFGYASGMPDPAGSTNTYSINRSMRCLFHAGA